MQNGLLDLLKEYSHVAVVISICASILVAVAGVIPSIFITGANILFFGFWNGTLISFLGEAAGAGIAFLLYRKGFKKNITQRLNRYPPLKKLTDATGRKAFQLVFVLRLIPFVPSGLVTFAAAVGSVSLSIFFLASSLGKIPALLLEAYSVYEITQFGWQGKIILAIVGIGLLYYLVRRRNNGNE